MQTTEQSDRGRRRFRMGGCAPGDALRRAGRLIAAALVGVALGAAAQPEAGAFVRSRTRSCQPVFWPQGCLYIQPDSELLGSDLDPASAEAAIKNAIAAWNDHLGVSSFLQLRYLAPRGPQEVNPLDGLQLLKFRRNRFCRPVTATTSMEVCFDQSATAVTTVTFINRPSDPSVDGMIVDADIDFNGVDFRFYDADRGLPPLSGRPPVDLWNTVTHELGHVMGLEHTCSLFAGGIPACVVDDQGRPVPDCSEVELDRSHDPRLQTLYEATMYPSAAPGETTKRQPHADDVAGVITAYPRVRDPMTCRLPAVVPYGCAAASPAFSAAASPALSAATAAWQRAALGLAGAVFLALCSLRALARRQRR